MDILKNKEDERWRRRDGTKRPSVSCKAETTEPFGANVPFAEYNPLPKVCE
jgi:hypothetical protein